MQMYLRLNIECFFFQIHRDISFIVLKIKRKIIPYIGINFIKICNRYYTDKKWGSTWLHALLCINKVNMFDSNDSSTKINCL